MIKGKDMIGRTVVAISSGSNVNKVHDLEIGRAHV